MPYPSLDFTGHELFFVEVKMPEATKWGRFYLNAFDMRSKRSQDPVLGTAFNFLPEAFKNTLLHPLPDATIAFETEQQAAAFTSWLVSNCCARRDTSQAPRALQGRVCHEIIEVTRRTTPAITADFEPRLRRIEE